MRDKARDHFFHVVQSFFDGFAIKTFLSAICGFIMYSVGYDYLVIEVLAYLILVDLVLGGANAIKNKNFTSFRFSRTLYKMLFYLTLLIAAHQAIRLQYIPQWFDELVEMLIVVTEIKSIFENSALLGFKYAIKIEAKLNKFIDDKLK
ncbi:MAG: phage holin family protein [Parcubacteria group bacterium]